MAFANEKIPKADWEKYDIYKINGRWNGAGAPANDWTIDRDRDIWLRLFYEQQDHTMPDGGYTGKMTWDFYWKGFLMSVETQCSNPREIEGKPFLDVTLLSINIPFECNQQRSDLIADLKEIYSAHNLYGIYSGKTKVKFNFDFGE